MRYIKSNVREYGAFLVCGGLNTLLTYVLYILFLRLMSYKLSYSVAYVLGIVISYYLNSRFVFREPVSLGKLLQYPVVYIVQYLLGIAVLYICVDLLSMNKWLAPAVVIAVSLPVTFLLSKFIIKRPAEASFRSGKK